jgi:transcriptional regulator with XRE-family HTH domain
MLRDWRQNAELTQRDLAKRLKKPASYVAKSELGERRIDPVEMVHWCRACRITPADAMSALDQHVQ